MNTLTRSLAEFCRSHPGDEKWLIAPTLRVGHQWIDSVAASGRPVLNLHALTLRSAAIRLALPDPGRPGLAILRSLDSMLLCGSLFNKGQSPDGYLLSLKPTLPLIRRLAHLLEELRLAGITPGSLAARPLENRRKAAELAQLLDGFAAFLDSRQLADYPWLLRLAAESVKLAEKQLPWLLLPAGTELSVVERELRGAYPPDRVVELPVDLPEDGYGWTRQPGADSRFSSSAGQRVEIVRAVGASNEIRQALRKILSGPWPLEQVELIHTSRDTYVPLIYEILAACVPDKEELPVTFADGVPSACTRPGKALAGWLRWIGADFAQAALVRLIAGGLLVLPQKDGTSLPVAHLAPLLSSLPVGAGRGRWLEVLQRELRRLERGVKALDEDGGGESEGKQNPHEIDNLRLLLKLVTRLLEISPGPGKSGKELAAGAHRLLEGFAVHVNELDTYARRALLDRLEALNGWLKVHGSEGFDIAAYLAELADSVPVMGNAPQPGKLHVSGIADGGHSGRPVTVIVGLDDSRWPPSDSQNPLLLDSERKNLGDNLPTAAGRQERAVREFHLLLARLRGRVILSFASSDPLDERELFPSRLLLPIYREYSGTSNARQKQMLDSLAPPSSFAPPDTKSLCSAADWWLSSMLGRPRGECDAVLESYFPHLAAGELARWARLSDVFGEFDGLLGAPGPDVDPFHPDGPVLSASRLQDLGACPRRYFYRYVLALEEPRQAPQPSEWLNPAERGQLLHEVLYRFLARLGESSLLPDDSARQREMLRELADRELASFRENYPVPGEAAFQARRSWLLQACRAFLSVEAGYCQSHAPRWLEASIGMRGQGSEIGCEDALALKVPGGTVRVRGRVDRIDSLAGGSDYAITDYKSGSSGSYELSKPFNGGRRVQHALYLEMVQQRLDELEHGAAVTSFRYFFPAGSERGDEAVWSAGELKLGTELIGLLCGISREGVYAATEETGDCGICAFTELCGDLEAQAEAGKRKRENTANEKMRDVLRVRDYA